MIAAVGETRHHSARLALLLAGAGSACRLKVATLPVGAELLAGLAAEPRLAPLCRAAADLVGAPVQSVLTTTAAAGWSWLIPGDAGFPAALASMTDPPLGLFVRGTMPPGPSAAVVGSRHATAYGCEVVRLLAAEMAAAGVTLVSGMAHGIDAAGHRAMLERGGRTVAVWGTGPDQVYPADHAGLAEDIAASGALVTEYPPRTPPRRHHFPERNRLIAAWSPAVVVVEAAARSGALVTARLAVDEGREVLAVPGSILAPLSVGPNALIRMGARPLLTPRDLFEAIGVACRTAPSSAPSPASPSDHPLLAALDPATPAAADDLAAATGRPVAEVLAELLALELDGAVTRGEDGRYRRR